MYSQAMEEILSGIMFCACFHIFSWPTAGLMGRDGRINKLQFLLAATVMSSRGEAEREYRKRSLCVCWSHASPHQHKVHDFCFGFFRARTQEAMEIRIYRKLIIEHLIRSVEEEEEEEVILPVDYK